MKDAIAAFVNFNNNHVYSFFITDIFLIIVIVVIILGRCPQLVEGTLPLS